MWEKVFLLLVVVIIIVVFYWNIPLPVSGESHPMGRKSAPRQPQNIRNMIKGLKNRWGRFQCPRDGSICKSLEAWHWHRIKYHPSQNIDYVELDADDDDFGGKISGGGRRSPPPPSTPSHPAGGHGGVASVAVIPPRLHLPPLSPSDRLLPPEAFAPLRPEVVVCPEVAFPDDVSDLTEPEIPMLLLSEDVVSVQRDTDDPMAPKEVKISKQEHQNLSQGSPVHHHPLKHQQHPLKHPELAPNPENKKRPDTLKTNIELCVSPPCEWTRNHDTVDDQTTKDCSDRTDSIQMSSPVDHGSILKMISKIVIEMFDPNQTLTVDTVLPRVESFSRWGLSRETIEGVVTGTLVGALDQWKRGYEAGWREGAKEVLNAPLLTNLVQQRHSLDGDHLHPIDIDKNLNHQTSVRLAEDDLEITLGGCEGRADDQLLPVKVIDRERCSIDYGDANNNRKMDDNEK